MEQFFSWHEDEIITPEQDLELGKELAGQWFAGFQSLVGVHIDRNHVRCAWSKDKYYLMQNKTKDSFMAECGIACLDALKASCSREEFIQHMSETGWNRVISYRYPDSKTLIIWLKGFIGKISFLKGVVFLENL